jgi:hypothetical protein
MAKAFTHRQEVAVERAEKQRTLRGVAIGALVAAAAAALLVFVTREPTQVASLTARDSAGAAAATVAKAPSKPAPASSPTAPAEPASKQAEPSWIEARTSERHAFAHASVLLDASTRVRFDAAETTLALDRGRIEVEVDASRGKPFSVTTQHFRVRVLGTHFVVTPDTVVVEHGRVEVLDLSGAVLARELGAGASFSYPRSAAASDTRTPSVTARAWLARARAALSEGDTKTAREQVAHAEQSQPTRADQAEAGTLRAEAALHDRDVKGALRLYESVATRYAQLTAGEDAAFAAAQLAGRAAPEAERGLLTRYLTTYPRGRFAREANVRLERLGAR